MDAKEPVRLGAAPKSQLEALKEVIQCVPDDQAKKLVEAYMRGDTITESLISRPELLDRGWTPTMSKKFLPEPVAERHATAYWLLSCVEEIEGTDEWKAASARAAARRAAPKELQPGRFVGRYAASMRTPAKMRLCNSSARGAQRRP